jgi:hypothetical protein
VSSQNGTLAVPTDIIVAWLRRVTAPPEAPRTTTDDPAVVEILKR